MSKDIKVEILEYSIDTTLEAELEKSLIEHKKQGFTKRELHFSTAASEDNFYYSVLIIWEK